MQTLWNIFHEGPVSERDYGAEYRELVGELCRRVAAANPEARFRRGRSRTAMILENGALLLVFGALIGVWVVLRPPMPRFQILVFPVTLADTDLARELLVSTGGISARDAVHAAVMINNGVERVATWGRGFDRIGRVGRLEL